MECNEVGVCTGDGHVSINVGLVLWSLWKDLESDQCIVHVSGRK